MRNKIQTLLLATGLLMQWGLSSTKPQKASNDEFFEAKSTFGGYGELHLNYKNPEKGKVEAKLDFHRFVLFYGYAWTPEWSFKSEVELEHNFVTDDKGELELEQAYLNWRHSKALNLQVGVLLPSVGLINEGHEPPLFFGTERPNYNKRIIPTTWFGNGIAATGMISSIDYKVVIMEGLNSSQFANGLRDGRQKGYKASLENVLVNGRVDYIGLPGLKAGASFSRNHLMFSNGDQAFESANLIEGHVRYDANQIIATGEVGTVSYSPFSSAPGSLEGSLGAYTQIGYNVGQFFMKKGKLYPFFHWSQYNVNSSVKGGGKAEEEKQVSEIQFGLHFAPIPQVVFKADYGIETKGVDDKKSTIINLGAGYMF